MPSGPSRFPEDAGFRTDFTARLMAHDFGKGPYFTVFLNPWEQALAMSEMVLHQRPFHVTAWGGSSVARGKVLGLHPFEPIDPARFPLLYFRASPAATFGTLSRDTVLEALMAPQGGSYGWMPMAIGDVNPAGPDWVGVVLASPGLSLAAINHHEVRVVAADVGDMEANPGRVVGTRAGGSVASLRLDAIASLAHRPNREQFKRLVENGGCLVNYKPVTKGSHPINLHDLISLRGFPTVQVREIGTPNKKSRIWVRVEPPES
ncbi:MAG: hypothetical protein ABI743_13755 [bacterium]